jgi:type IV pilus assembly protein PilB
MDEEIARALAALADDRDEMAIRRPHPRARFRDPHPVFQLTSAIIRRAIEGGASEVQLVPEADGLSVRFLGESATGTVMTLPRPLGEPVIARLKDGAGMDVEQRDAPQEGFIPVLRDGALYEMSVSARPDPDGETILLRISPSADGPYI